MKPVETGGDSVDVLFILGKGRSGSTLLDNVLGSVDGMVTVGELSRLWTWGSEHGYFCGCGEPVPQCPFWNSVLEHAGFDTSPSGVEHLAQLQQTVVRWHWAPRLLRQDPEPSRRWHALDEWSKVMGKVYSAVAEVADAEVVVDASKIPVSPVAMGLVPGVEPFLLHLVRDPRAVAHSWRRRKRWTDRADGEEMPRFNALHTVASWTARNLMTEVLVARAPDERTAFLRYEDFAEVPRATVDSILELVGLPGAATPFTDERTAVLSPNHTVGGNPDRVGRREVEITPDTGWQERGGATSAVVGALTWPLRRRYGYTSGSTHRVPGA